MKNRRYIYPKKINCKEQNCGTLKAQEQKNVHKGHTH